MSKARKLTLLLLAIGWGLEKLVWPQETVVEVAQSQEQVSSPPVPIMPTPSLILRKLNEGDDRLEKTPLLVGTKDIPYVETRISRDGEKVAIKNKKLAEPEKEIALKLLDLETEQVEVIKITKKGAELISPPGYKIEVIQRPSGIKWNKWNTPYRVLEPHHQIVLKNKYPEIAYETVKERVKNKAGQWITASRRKKVIREIIYSPYSEDLHTVELVESGARYIKGKVAEARTLLTERGVKSKAFPDRLVTEVEILEPEIFAKLPLLEQTDFGESLLDPQKSFERVQVILAANPGTAYAHTCSSASACGWVQFTQKTYQAIRKAYPAAHLNPDFESGAADHLNSMMAAILLFDYNLNGFMDRHGKNIVNNPLIKEYLAASYNGSPTTASKSLKAAIGKNLPDWTGKLKLETKGFIAKFRYLVAHDLPQ